MNFGDILKKWEKGQTGVSYDKDANAEASSVRGENRRRLLNSQPDDILDIHGLTDEQAWLSLDNFFSRAKDRGHEKLRIIHGKGNRSQGEAVLGKTVRNFIERCSFAGESGREKSINGGTGATWVLLKLSMSS